MRMEAIPRHWASWSFTLTHPSGALRVDMSGWRTAGAFAFAGHDFRIRKSDGGIVLEEADAVLARATKPSMFRRLFVIEVGDKEYTLRPVSFLGRTFAVFQGDHEIGHIAPAGFITRRARVELPDEWPVGLQTFVVWLVILLWKRDDSAGAAGAAAVPV